MSTRAVVCLVGRTFLSGLRRLSPPRTDRNVRAVLVHEPRMTAVQMRTSRCDVEPELATLGPWRTAEGGVSDRRG